MTLALQDPTVSTTVKCQICGNRANRSHYGVLACNACGSFFRRTILLRRNYLCSKRNCHLKGNGSMCKKCRLQSCIDAGMAIDSILIRKVLSNEDQYKDCSLLERSVKALDSTFVNKINILSKIAHKNNVKLELGVLNPSKHRMDMSKISEYKTLMLYLNDCGYREMGLCDTDLNKIAERTFYRWLTYSAFITTLRNGGHHENIMHLSDCGYVPLTFENCQAYFKDHQSSNVSTLVNAYYDLLERGMQVSKQFHQAHLDKTEFALLLQLIILKEAKELFPQIEEINKTLNGLLKQASEYYEENYQESAVRLADLIFLTYHVNNLDVIHNEFAHLLTLSGFRTILSQIRRNYDFFGSK